MDGKTMKKQEIIELMSVIEATGWVVLRFGKSFDNDLNDELGLHVDPNLGKYFIIEANGGHGLIEGAPLMYRIFTNKTTAKKSVLELQESVNAEDFNNYPETKKLSLALCGTVLDFIAKI